MKRTFLAKLNAQFLCCAFASVSAVAWAQPVAAPETIPAPADAPETDDDLAVSDDQPIVAEAGESMPMPDRPAVPAPAPAPPPAPAIMSAFAAVAAPEPAGCTPSPRPCVRIMGLFGLSFYVVESSRFRYWATEGGRVRFDAGRGIDKMLAIGIDTERISRNGHINTQLDRIERDYWIIPWCAREEDGREVWKASWQTKQKIAMRTEAIAEASISCQS